MPAINLKWFRIVQFGEDAMHYATDIITPWGILCFKPPTRCFGEWWPWYVWFSPDGTPPKGRRSITNWGLGPGCYE